MLVFCFVIVLVMNPILFLNQFKQAFTNCEQLTLQIFD